MTHSNGVANGAAARPLPQICYKLRQKVLAFLDEDLQDEALRKVQHQVRVSNTIIEDALRRYGLQLTTPARIQKNSREHLSISYNGGKDCLVLLVLLLACLPVVHPPSASPSDTSDDAAVPSLPEPVPFKALYIVSSKPFQEVEDFVAATADEYHLDLDRYVTKMRPAIEEYLAKRPEVSAIFMGTRRTDPHAELLTHFDVTDKDWPQFMRVHPVIDWHYVEIWAFIRHLEIPFCELYNRGFTSLGGVTDTRPNPALAVGNDATHFRPAYELRDDDEERLGRDR
ncbi:hypothetical protein AK830_g11227 [Neonectria ditissima]|uniref:FAD synthase n=1 Tax=Neonectria ditissima TaxID=78410 RepID=A0A0P7AN11_9HYPO|nr:hypothetical protein AK830_g11227 [Neonectria ditissima]